MKKQLPDDWKSTLRAEIDDALKNHMGPKKRTAFADVAVSWASFMRAGLIASAPEPRRMRRQLKSALTGLQAACAALTSEKNPKHPSAIMPESLSNDFAEILVTCKLSERGTRMVGPNFPERPMWDGTLHPVSVRAMLEEIIAATSEVRDDLKGVRPNPQARAVRDHLRGLAIAYWKTTGREPMSTPGGHFFRCARAVCLAAGCRGMTNADLVAALHELPDPASG